MLVYQFPATSLTFYGSATHTRYRVSGGVPVAVDSLDADDFLKRVRRNKPMFAIAEEEASTVDPSESTLIITSNMPDSADLVVSHDEYSTVDGLVESMAAAVKGVGKVTAEKLVVAGVNTPLMLAARSAQEVSDITGLSIGKAQKIIENAK